MNQAARFDPLPEGFAGSDTVVHCVSVRNGTPVTVCRAIALTAEQRREPRRINDIIVAEMLRPVSALTIARRRSPLVLVRSIHSCRLRGAGCAFVLIVIGGLYFTYRGDAVKPILQVAKQFR